MDVVEKLNVTFSASGAVHMSEIQGSIQVPPGPPQRIASSSRPTSTTPPPLSVVLSLPPLLWNQVKNYLGHNPAVKIALSNNLLIGKREAQLQGDKQSQRTLLSNLPLPALISLPN